MNLRLIFLCSFHLSLISRIWALSNNTSSITHNVTEAHIDISVGSDSQEKVKVKDDDLKKSEEFSLLRHLPQLAIIELEIYKLFHEFRHLLESTPLKLSTFVTSYLTDYEESSYIIVDYFYTEGSDEWAEIIASHPLAAYRMIRRFVSDLPLLQFLLKEHGFDSAVETIGKLKEEGSKWRWPSSGDLERILRSILRLNYVYNFDTIMLSEGVSFGLPINIGVSTLQAFEIAQFALKEKCYTLALGWLFVVRHRIELHGEFFDEGLLMSLTQSITNEHDLYFDENINTMNNLHIYTTKMSETPLDSPLTTLIDHQLQFKGSRTADYELFDYFALCNGDNFQTTYEKASLICWNERSLHPFWVLNPIRIEAFSWDPLVVRIFDVMDEVYLNDLITESENIGKKPSKKLTQADLRVSKRIELITGLKVLNGNGSGNGSEPIRLIQYPFGEGIDVHHDLDELRPQPEHRIATFLTYLNDPGSGSFTVFPRIGLAIEPIHGTSLFWFNSLRNGDVDTRLSYGTCPPLYGKQSLAVKWILAGSNFLVQNCDTSPYI